MAGWLLVAVTAIGWLGWQATGRRQSAAEAIEARQHTLQVAAQFAASEILKEIDLRFDTLSRIAADPELRQQMAEIKKRPDDRALWKRLEEWLGTRKADNDGKIASNSWFITAANGIQVARSPRSEASRGENYAHQRLFSWTAAPKSRRIPKTCKPIEAPHLSAVYRSTSTGHLQVAFSVPIDNGKRGNSREILGVLAMSVDLGEFNVLQKQLPPGHEVVLIDLRLSKVDGQLRRGLILHHEPEPNRVGTSATVDRERDAREDRRSAQQRRCRRPRQLRGARGLSRRCAHRTANCIGARFSRSSVVGRKRPCTIFAGWSWCRNRCGSES